MEKNDQKFQFYDHFCESPFLSSSGETTPDSHSHSHRPSSISEPTTSNCLSPSSSEDSTVMAKKNFDQRKTRNYVSRIREHVKMGQKLSETVKGKLSVGAKIIQNGGRENMFKQVFGMSEEGEKVLKASQCYLSTTAGPIAGILFISTHKVAFCSERPITLPSPSGLLHRTPYKVIIPLTKIKVAKESMNVEKPSQKYIQIVTQDNFEFWLMGFVRYEKAFLNLQKAISMYKN